MENTKNKRRIPTGECLKMKTVNYILYIKLQQISFWNQNDNHRYIDWTRVNKTDLCKELRTARRYLNPRLEKLQESGLIRISYDESNNIKNIKLLNNSEFYVLMDLEGINFHFLKLMMEFTKDVCWRVYLCHIAERNRVKKKYGKDEYYITREEIAKRIGYSTTNLDRIQRCNEFLKEIGTIDYRKEYKNNKTVNVYKVLK